MRRIVDKVESLMAFVYCVLYFLDPNDSLIPRRRRLARHKRQIDLAIHAFVLYEMSEDEGGMTRMANKIIYHLLCIILTIISNFTWNATRTIRRWFPFN